MVAAHTSSAPGSEPWGKPLDFALARGGVSAAVGLRHLLTSVTSINLLPVSGLTVGWHPHDKALAMAPRDVGVTIGRADLAEAQAQFESNPARKQARLKEADRLMLLVDNTGEWKG